jgi:hypothetical protein
MTVFSNCEYLEVCGEVLSIRKCVLVDQDGVLLLLEQSLFQVPNRDVSAVQPLTLVYPVSCCAVNPARLLAQGCPDAQAEISMGLLYSAQLSGP